MTSYPYFPGVVIDHVDKWDTVPQSVLDLEDQSNGRTWLVRFHDKQRSYAWVHRERMEKIGADDARDQIFLSVSVATGVVEHC